MSPVLQQRNWAYPERPARNWQVSGDLQDEELVGRNKVHVMWRGERRAEGALVEHQYRKLRKAMWLERRGRSTQPTQRGAAYPICSRTGLASVLENTALGFQNSSRVPWLSLGRVHLFQQP